MVACRRKNHWVQEQAAHQAALKQERKYGWALRVYACDQCDEYHVTRRRHNGLPVLLMDWIIANWQGKKDK